MRGAAPKESLITQGTTRGQIFPENPDYFLLLFRLLDSNKAKAISAKLLEFNFKVHLYNPVFLDAQASQDEMIVTH